MKKILFLGLGDGQIHHELPAFFLAKHDYEVTCIGLDSTLKIEQFYRAPPNLKKIKRKKYAIRIINILMTGISIAKQRNQFDILYLYSPHNIITAWIATVGYRGKIIYHTQDFLNPNKYRLRTKLEKSVMKKSDFTITNEENRSIFLQAFYDLKKRPLTVKTTLPSDFPFNNFDEERRKQLFDLFDKTEEESSEYRFILHIGGFSEKRCSQTIIESFRNLPDNYKLVFTNSEKGSSSFTEIMNRANELGISSQLITFGRLSELELFNLCAQADVGLLMYPDDDIGNIYQAPGRLSEYLGSGIKVVTPDYPGLKYVVERFSFGVVCNPKSSYSIANAISRLCANSIGSEERDFLKSKFLDNYSYENDFEHILEHIQRLDK